MLINTSTPQAQVTYSFTNVPTSVTAGSSFNVTVTARDQANQVVTSYTGKVHFTSSDGSASLPSDYTFVATDHGKHLFKTTFVTPGVQTLTVTDVSSTAIAGTANVWVKNKPPFPWLPLPF